MEFSKDLKRRIKRRDNFTCQVCGITEARYRRKLDIHHIDYNKGNNSETNLITLGPGVALPADRDRHLWAARFAILTSSNLLAVG